MSEVFSEYDLREMGIKTVGSSEYKTASCVGSCEEETEVKVITKKCRGDVVYETVKPKGNGTLKFAMHMPWDIYCEVFGMNHDGLIDGVKGYGDKSIHKHFSIVQHIYDELENEKYKAYPNCVIKTGRATKIENGAEEVAQIELEVSFAKDSYGFGIYEALASELEDETVKSKWMTAFEPAMVQVASV